jgi:GT2 family glycosyltransferase
MIFLLTRASIIIVNWNSGLQLLACLASLRKNVGKIVESIVVVDNGSTDGSAADVGQIDPRIVVLDVGINLGFAAGCNLGARKCDSPLLLFLNPDTLVFPGAIESVAEFLGSPEGSEYGICGVRLVDENAQTHRSCARFPSCRTLLARALGSGAVFHWLLPSYVMTDFGHHADMDVDHVIGAFFAVRRSLFDHLGGFDERFFLYLEDLDFSYRARQSGWRTRYLAGVSSFHKGGGTSEQAKGRRLFYSLRCRILYAFKHLPRRQAMYVTVATLLLEPLPRLVRAGLRGSIDEAREIIEGYTFLWLDMPNFLRKALIP